MNAICKSKKFWSENEEKIGGILATTVETQKQRTSIVSTYLEMKIFNINVLVEPKSIMKSAEDLYL